MQITIKQCLKAKPPYNGINKQGKPYILFQRPCILSDDTVSDVKAMSQELFDTIADGAVLDVEQKEFNGTISYMVNRPGASGNGGGWKGGKQWTPPAKIPWATYVTLCCRIHAEAKKIDPDHVTELFDRMLSNASVMLDIAALRTTPTCTPATQSAPAKPTPAKQSASLNPAPATQEEADDHKKFLESGGDPWASEGNDDDSIFDK